MYFFWYPNLYLCWRNIFDWTCRFPLLLVANLCHKLGYTAAGLRPCGLENCIWPLNPLRENMQLASGSVTGHQQVFVSTGVINSQHGPRAKDGTNHFFPLLATTGIIWDCMPLEKDSTAKPGCAMMNLYIMHALMYRYNQITSARFSGATGNLCGQSYFTLYSL